MTSMQLLQGNLYQNNNDINANTITTNNANNTNNGNNSGSGGSSGGGGEGGFSVWKMIPKRFKRSRKKPAHAETIHVKRNITPESTHSRDSSTSSSANQYDASEDQTASDAELRPSTSSQNITLRQKKTKTSIIPSSTNSYESPTSMVRSGSLSESPPRSESRASTPQPQQKTRKPPKMPPLPLPLDLRRDTSDMSTPLFVVSDYSNVSTPVLSPISSNIQQRPPRDTHHRTHSQSHNSLEKMTLKEIGTPKPLSTKRISSFFGGIFSKLGAITSRPDSIRESLHSSGRSSSLTSVKTSAVNTSTANDHILNINTNKDIVNNDNNGGDNKPTRTPSYDDMTKTDETSASSAEDDRIPNRRHSPTLQPIPQARFSLNLETAKTSNAELEARRKSDPLSSKKRLNFYTGSNLSVGAVLSWREKDADGHNTLWKDQSISANDMQAPVAIERVHTRAPRAESSNALAPRDRSDSYSSNGDADSPRANNTSVNNAEKGLGLADFLLMNRIGRGGYGDVYSSRKKDTNEICALKIMDKSNISRKNKVLNIRNEREAMSNFNSESWIVQLLYAFQDDEKVYLAMEFLPGGDLRGMLNSLGSLDEEDLRTYGAEMTLAVNEVHELGFIHRDLKPENFLVDKTGHLKVADLGISTSGVSALVDLKIKVKAIHKGTLISSELVLNDDKSKLRRRMSIVGSPAYMAPEILEENNTGYGPEVDWWSLGCIFCEVLTGMNPFEGPSPEFVFANLSKWREKLRDVDSFLREKMSPVAYSLICGFLCEPQKRLGRNGIPAIQSHPFFEGVNWSNLRERTPPVVPVLSGDTDTSYFTADLKNSNSNIIKSESTRFITINGFDYNSSNVSKRLN